MSFDGMTDDDIDVSANGAGEVVVQIGAMHPRTVNPENARKWADDLEDAMPEGSETPGRMRELADGAEP